MSLLTLPFEIPARLVQRALDDVGAIAAVARELPGRLDALDARAAAVQAQIDRALTVGEAIERHGAEVVGLGERMLALGDLAMERSELMADRAKEVADRGADVAAALPTLQRAVSIAEPLEGAVERLGRAIDRLPGGRPRPPESDTPHPERM